MEGTRRILMALSSWWRPCSHPLIPSLSLVFNPIFTFDVTWASRGHNVMPHPCSPSIYSLSISARIPLWTLNTTAATTAAATPTPTLRGILVQVVSKACEAQHRGVVFMDLRVALGHLAIGPSTQRRLEIRAARDLRCSCGIFLGLDVHH